MLTGRKKLYFLLNHIDDVRVITPSNKLVSIDPLNDLNNRLRKDELSNLFIKLDQDEKVIKLIKAPSSVKTEIDDLDPYDKADDGCWYIEIKPTFDRYFSEIQQESDYKEFSSRSPRESKTNQKHDLALLHPVISERCQDLFKKGTYAEAVEKGFKVVKDRLRTLTTYEKGSEAFGKGKLHIKGASALNVDHDFNEAVKFLTMAIDMFRNEKSHTSDAKIEDPQRAYEYLTLSSLAMNLLDQAEIISS